MIYDSAEDTLKHKALVKYYIAIIINNLMSRAADHDNSKLSPPEKVYFDKYTPKLRGVSYGSPQYYSYIKDLEIALTHHYAKNPHHPEHYTEGVSGMNLIDLVEMFCDWMAATSKHADGDIFYSIEHNSKRFNIDYQLKSIFINSINLLESGG